jgi:hypothetical protein
MVMFVSVISNIYHFLSLLLNVVPYAVITQTKFLIKIISLMSDSLIKLIIHFEPSNLNQLSIKKLHLGTLFRRNLCIIPS